MAISDVEMSDGDVGWQHHMSIGLMFDVRGLLRRKQVEAVLKNDMPTHVLYGGSKMHDGGGTLKMRDTWFTAHRQVRACVHVEACTSEHANWRMVGRTASRQIVGQSEGQTAGWAD